MTPRTGLVTLPTPAAPASLALHFTCDVCGKPAQNGKAAIFLRASELRDAKAAHHRKQKAEREHGLPVVSGSELRREWQERVRPARWRVACYVCDSTPDDCYYWFDVERMRYLSDFGSHEGFLGWNEHLHEKIWLPLTDWSTRFLARVIGAIDAAGAK